jgi:hypothetical protein
MGAQKRKKKRRKKKKKEEEEEKFKYTAILGQTEYPLSSSLHLQQEGELEQECAYLPLSSLGGQMLNWLPGLPTLDTCKNGTAVLGKGPLPANTGPDFQDLGNQLID